MGVARVKLLLMHLAALQLKLLRQAALEEARYQIG
jgi:hypothetical protein